MSTTDFPQPQRKDGGEPCAECHIQHGETCDICGAVGPGPHAATPSPSPDLDLINHAELVLSNGRVSVAGCKMVMRRLVSALSRLRAVEERYLKLVDLYSMAETEAVRLRAELDEAREAHHRRGSRIATLEVALETKLVEVDRIDRLRDEWRLAANNWQTRAESAESALASMREALTLARGRLELLLDATLEGSDHPGATRYVLSVVYAALKEGTP